MRCNMCFTINEEDAIFCKNCGARLDEYEEKTKEKVKKQKGKKGKKGKSHSSKKKINKKYKTVNKDKKGMTLIQKTIMFIMILLIIVLFGVIGVFGYYYYTQNNVAVPDVTGMSYENAQIELIEDGFKVSKKEVDTDDDKEDGIVLKQSKSAGKKVLKGSTIKLYVGKIDQTYPLGNYVGMNIQDVISSLESDGVSYKINYAEGEEGIVLKQSPSSGNTIKKGDTVYLTVGKTEKQENLDDANDKQTDDNTEEETTE